MSTSLEVYIQNARTQKIADEQIKTALIAAGWPKDKVVEALTQKPLDGSMPPPPPPPVPHVGMWVGFLYILFFISLYVLATSIGAIFHTFVDKTIPNIKTDQYSQLSDQMPPLRGFVSSLIVSYPIFLILAITLKKQLVKQPMVRNLRSRKILIYLTLIGTFLLMLGHVIATIYDFLSGTLTTNALGHLVVTLLIAGSIFGYFINEVKNDRKNS
ncbi:MAG TPA: DUF5671 domain-containing protein [Methylomirabilota bacterium]|nr:DUF5671 domain-containing protein [Methylomirabilota bacterium]